MYFVRRALEVVTPSRSNIPTTSRRRRFTLVGDEIRQLRDGMADSIDARHCNDEMPSWS